MRIVKVTPFFWPSEGGTQRAALHLSEEFVKMGHQVSVLSYNASDNTAKGLICTSQLKSNDVLSGISIHRFNYTSIPSGGLKYSSTLSIYLTKLLLKKRCDVVHYHGFFHLPNVLSISMVCKATRTPMFLTTHGLHEVLYDYNHARKRLTKLFALVSIKLILRTVDKFVALTQADKLALMGFGLSESKIVCVPNGVDTEKFGKQALDGTILDRYGLCGKGPLLLSVCRISRNKGLTFLIEAASNVSSKIAGLHILIIGPIQEPSYKTELTNLTEKLNASSIVNFRENVPDDDLVEFYKIADLFVLPSEQETLPLVILEAMAAGCPLIATSVGGIPNVVTDGQNGLLVKPGNIAELADRIRLILSDSTLNNHLREEEKKTVAVYSWTKIASEIMVLYRKSLLTSKDASSLSPKANSPKNDGRESI